MALAPGVRLGPYEIVSALGAGGMGELYKARDTRLERAVAIKVLRESVAADTGRLSHNQRPSDNGSPIWCASAGGGRKAA